MGIKKKTKLQTQISRKVRDQISQKGHWNGCLDSMERGTVEWNSGTVE